MAIYWFDLEVRRGGPHVRPCRRAGGAPCILAVLGRRLKAGRAVLVTRWPSLTRPTRATVPDALPQCSGPAFSQEAQMKTRKQPVTCNPERPSVVLDSARGDCDRLPVVRLDLAVPAGRRA